MQQLPPQEVYSQGNGPWLPQQEPLYQVPPQEVQSPGDGSWWPQESPPAEYYKRPRPSVAQMYPDDSDRRASLISADGRPKPDYRPVSLRWWFISILIAVFAAVIGLVLYGNSVMRNSDNTAKIDQRSLGHDEAWLMYRNNMVEARQTGNIEGGITSGHAGGNIPTDTIQQGNIPSDNPVTKPDTGAGTIAPAPISETTAPAPILGGVPAPGTGAGAKASPTITTADGQEGLTNSPDGSRSKQTDGAAAPDALEEGMKITTGMLEVSTMITVTEAPQTTVVQVTSEVTKDIVITSTLVTSVLVSKTGQPPPAQPSKTKAPPGILPEPPKPPVISVIPGKPTTRVMSVTSANSTYVTTTVETGPDETVTLSDVDDGITTADDVPSDVETATGDVPEPTATGGGGGGIGGGNEYVVTTIYTKLTTQTVEQTTKLSTSVKAGNVFATPGVTRIFTTYTIDREGEVVRGPVTQVHTEDVAGKVITYVDDPVEATQVETAAAGMLITQAVSVTKGQLITNIATATAGQLVTQVAVAKAGELVKQIATASEGQVVTQVTADADGRLVTEVLTASAGQFFTVMSTAKGGERVTQVAAQLVTQVAVAKAGELVTQVATASEGQVITQVTADANGQLVTQVLTASAGQFFTVMSTASGGELVTKVAGATAGQIITAVMTASEDGVVDEVETASQGQLITRVSTHGGSTRVSSIPPTRAVITSITTPTTGADVRIVVAAKDYNLTPTSYFIGKFLPPIVAVIIALAIRAVDQTAKLYQPFAALSRPQGATGRNSLSLHFDGWNGFWRPFTLLRDGHAAPFLTTLAAGGSALLAPLASASIGLKIHGHCSASSIQGCALSLGITTAAAYALIALCGVMAILLISLIFVVSRRWKTGVFADPWCVAGTAALVRNPDVRLLGLLDWRTLKTTVAEKQFALGWFRNTEGREEYGIVMNDESGRSLQTPGTEAYPQQVVDDGRQKKHTPFAALTFWWRIAFMAYLTVLLALVLYYHITEQLTDESINFVPNTFKKLLEKQRVVTRFIASGLGVIVIFCWECVYTSIATIAPYQRMARGLQTADRSVLSRRPAYAVTGLYWGIRERDPLFFLTALMAVLAQLLPITLANVPYDLTQTQLANSACSRISAGLLAIMITFLFGLLFISFPPLPVDPRSIAGAMWYTAGSRWVGHLEGVTLMTGKERDRRMAELGGRWYYGVADSRVGGRLAVDMQEVYRSVEYGGRQSWAG